MEGAPLNKAHQELRRAETLVRQGKLDEAIQSHIDIIVYLDEATKLTDNELALKSLSLQKQHSERQIDLIKKKKKMCDIYRKSLSEQKHKVERSNSSDSFTFDEPLEDMILRKIEQHDSLIFHLVKKGSSASDSESLKSYSDTEEKIVSFDVIDYSNPNPIVGSKLPKTEGNTIEELNILSGQLKYLIQQLMAQLEDRNKEIETLKAKIHQLESEKLKAQSKSNNSLRVITDSSGGTSPFVFSPMSELSPDIHETRILPPLDPLDLPSFDYTNFKKICSIPSISE